MIYKTVCGKDRGTEEDLGEEERGSMTFDELIGGNKDYQAELDRRISKGIDTARTNWEKQAQEREQEAVRQSQMSAEERTAEALKREKDRADALQAENSRILLTQTAMQELSARQMPTGFAQWLTGADEAGTMANIEAFCTMFGEALGSELKKRPSGYVPMTGSEGDMFLEGFRK